MTGRALCFACIAACCLLLGSSCRGKKGADKRKDPPVPVQVLRIEPASITRTLRYNADIRAELSVKVFSQVAERIVALHVEEGDQVKKGQLLAVVRREMLTQGERSAAAALDAARADRDYIRAEIARQRKLLSRKIVPQATVDQLEAKLRATEAQIRRLQATASQASTARANALIRSPIAGIIGRRFLSQGDMAAPTLPLCTVVQMDRVELQLEVPEQDLAHIRDGMAATITVRRFPSERFAGKVTRISPTIDQMTRTARVKVELDNRQHRLMPGMLARVSLEVQRKDEVVVLPYKSLIVEMGPSGAPLHRVYTLNKDGRTVTGREVTLGIVDGDRAQVSAGLSFGETIVTRGQQLLRDGRKVDVVERLTPQDNARPTSSPADAGPSKKTEQRRHGEPKERS